MGNAYREGNPEASHPPSVVTVAEHAKVWVLLRQSLRYMPSPPERGAVVVFCLVTAGGAAAGQGRSECL